MSPRFSGVSSDGGTVVFTTQERLTADDTDSRADAYRVSGGALARVSTGPRGGNSPDHPVGSEPNAIGGDVLFMSDDGTRVVFSTFEQLTADDTDHQSDSYLWTPVGRAEGHAGQRRVRRRRAGSWSRPWSAARRTARTSCSSRRERADRGRHGRPPRSLRVGGRRDPARHDRTRRAATRRSTSTAPRSSSTSTAAASATCPTTARGSCSRRRSSSSPPTPTS